MDGTESRAEQRKREKAEREDEEKAKQRQEYMNALEIKMDARHITIRMGGQSIHIKVDRFGELNEKLAEARKIEVKRLQEEIKKLQLLDGSHEEVTFVETTQEDGDTEAAPKPASSSTPQPRKTYKMGECYTCDGPVRSGQGQPCVICKNTSHKKCLDTNVCGTCLDSTDED